MTPGGLFTAATAVVLALLGARLAWSMRPGLRRPQYLVLPGALVVAPLVLCGLALHPVWLAAAVALTLTVALHAWHPAAAR